MSEGKKKFRCINAQCETLSESILNLVNCPVCHHRYIKTDRKKIPFLEPNIAVRKECEIYRLALVDIMFQVVPSSALRKLASNAIDQGKRLKLHYEPQGMTMDENRRSGAV